MKTLIFGQKLKKPKYRLASLGLLFPSSAQAQAQSFSSKNRHLRPKHHVAQSKHHKNPTYMDAEASEKRGFPKPFAFAVSHSAKHTEMGRKKTAKEGGETRPQTEHSPSTVFVSNLPYSFTNSQVHYSHLTLWLVAEKTKET